MTTKTPNELIEAVDRQIDDDYDYRLEHWLCIRQALLEKAIRRHIDRLLAGLSQLAGRQMNTLHQYQDEARRIVGFTSAEADSSSQTPTRNDWILLTEPALPDANFRSFQVLVPQGSADAMQWVMQYTRDINTAIDRYQTYRAQWLRFVPPSPDVETPADPLADMLTGDAYWGDMAHILPLEQAVNDHILIKGEEFLRSLLNVAEPGGWEFITTGSGRKKKILGFRSNTFRWVASKKRQRLSLCHRYYPLNLGDLTNIVQILWMETDIATVADEVFARECLFTEYDRLWPY